MFRDEAQPNTQVKNLTVSHEFGKSIAIELLLRNVDDSGEKLNRRLVTDVVKFEQEMLPSRCAQLSRVLA